MTEALRIEPLEGVQVWTVDREPARNAMNHEVASALHRALDAAERDPALRAVVLTGAGRGAFISGADLKFLRNAPPEERAAMDAHMLSALGRLAALEVPVIAALNGAVVGGGMEVALACDLRIAEPHVTFTFKHAAMGVTPGWGGFARLSATVGRGTAAKLLFTALPIDAETALRVQLVDEIAHETSARERALALCTAIQSTSPRTIKNLKRLLHVAYEGRLSLDLEQAVFLESTRSADHAEALRAFFEKRPPRFEPRD